MSWVTDNWIPLTVVGGLVGVSWYAGKHFDESESYNADPSWNELMAMLKQQEQYEQHKKEQQKRMRNQRAKERRELKKQLKSKGLSEEEIKDYMKELARERRYKVAETFNTESYNASTKKTKPRKTNRVKTMIELNPDMPITSSFHPDNPMVGHIEQKCSSSVCDEVVFTHDRMIGKRCLKCYYQNWEDLYDMGATDTPPPVDMSIPYDERYKRNTPAEIAEQEKRSIALMKKVQNSRREKTRKGYEKIREESRIERQKQQAKWANYENDREWDNQYAQIMKDKKKMSDKGWRKKYGLKSESYNADEGLWNDASKEQRLKWLKDAIPSIGDKYADYTWRELTPRLQEEMADESFNAETHNETIYIIKTMNEENEKGYLVGNEHYIREALDDSYYYSMDGLYDDEEKHDMMLEAYQTMSIEKICETLGIPLIFSRKGGFYFTSIQSDANIDVPDYVENRAETFAAYVSKGDTQRVRQLLKQEFPNLKFSVVKDGGRMSVSIMAGDIDFSDINDDVPRTKRHWERWGNPKPVFDGRLDINQYHLDGYNPKYTPLFEKIVSIMKGEDWFDHSDSQTDYFHTAYYIDLNIGKWNKPYEYKPTIKKGTRPTLEGLVYKQGYGDDALTGLKGAYDAETFEASGVARKKGKTPVEKVLIHEELMNQAARNEMITKLTYDLAMRKGVHRQPMRTIKEAEYDSKLKKEFGDD